MAKKSGARLSAARSAPSCHPLPARARASATRMACAAAPAGAAAASAANPGEQDAGGGSAAPLRARLLSYFRDTVDGEPGGAETDPLQVSALRPVPRCVRTGADARAAIAVEQGMWLEGDSLAPFVVTPMANVLHALECVPAGRARSPACALTRSPAPPRSLAAVGPDDVLLDVGCGDGRVVVRANSGEARGAAA